MARGVVVVVEARGVQTPYFVGAKGEWWRVADAIRVELAEQTESGKCGSVVVSAHFADERCDHEVG